MTNDKDGAAMLPCPFCGGDAVMRRDDDPGYPWYVTFEHEPDCTMYALPTDMFRSFSTEAEAMAAWNRRTALKSHGQAFDAAGVREACAKVADAVAKGLADAENAGSDEAEEAWHSGCAHGAKRAADQIRALLIPEAPASVVDREITTKPVAVGETAAGVTQAPASVELVEYETLIAAGFDDYAARCALRTAPDGVFCHAYFYSDGQWRFQTGGNDLTLPDGTILRCVLTKRLYTRPEPDTIGSHFGNGGGLDPVADHSGDATYLICKGGAYYRPNAQGYTRNRSEAGRYTLEEAISYSHPNGPDGPRDGITYELDTAPPSPGFGGGDLREGPAPIPNTRMQCFGCKHLETEDWREPSGDGETFDRGTSADCKAIPGGQNIGVYWSRTNDAPKWCPFLAALSHDQRGGAGE